MDKRELRTEMPQNTILFRTVAVLVGIAALLFILGEAMSVWRATSEARKADVEAATLTSNRDLIVKNKEVEMKAGVVGDVFAGRQPRPPKD